MIKRANPLKEYFDSLQFLSPGKGSIKGLEGFTLAEVLLALALLGVVAAFSVPKILQSQSDSQQKLLMKETIASISDVTYSYYLNPDPSSTKYDYFKNRLNTIKECPNNARQEGCFGATDAVGEYPEPGFILPNGVMVAGIRADLVSVSFGDCFLVDVNGLSKPNLLGQDQIWLCLNMDQQKIYPPAPGVLVSPGHVDPTGPTSVALYSTLF